MSNYPPGVTGNEYAIAGGKALGATSREVQHECGYEGEAEGELEGYDHEVWFSYECPECGKVDTVDLDPDDFGPDPDEAHERRFED